MNKEEMPCITGFDELFEDGIFCGETTYIMPMEKDEMNTLMQEIISPS